MKVGSTKEPIQSVFLCLSQVARLDVPWLKDGDAVFQDPDHPLRHSLFAADIHPDNIIEGLRVHMSSSGYPLRCHIDSKNSMLPTMSAVVGLNMLHMSGQQRGCNGYSRISIDRTMNREDCDLPLVEHIADSYNTFPADQRNITNNLLKGPAVKLLGGFSFIRNPCNMDPLSYHLSFTHCILLLVHHFNLGFSEAIGRVQCAMDFLHHSSLFFVTACKCVLSCLPTSMFRKFRPGYKLGYVIVRLMKVYSMKERATAIVNRDQNTRHIPATRAQYCQIGRNGSTSVITGLLWLCVPFRVIRRGQTGRPNNYGTKSCWKSSHIPILRTWQ